MLSCWFRYVPVHLLLELELNSQDQNVNELEFELSRMYMKRRLGGWRDIRAGRASGSAGKPVQPGPKPGRVHWGTMLLDS